MIIHDYCISDVFLVMVFPILTPDHSLQQRLFDLCKNSASESHGGLAPETLLGRADSDNHVQLGAVLPTFDREVRGPVGPPESASTIGCKKDIQCKCSMKNHSLKFEVFGVIWVICFHLQSPYIADVVSNLN